MIKRKRSVYKKKPVRRYQPKALANPLPVKKYIPKMSPVELKYMDTEQTSVAIGTTIQKYLLNGCVQGTSTTSRIGNRIMIRKLEVLMQFTTQLGVNIKCSIVIDKQTNGAAFAGADLYNAIAGATYPWATRNSVNSQRFVTVANWFLTLNQQIASTNVNKQFRKFIKCNIPVQYNGGVAGTIADITSNSMYLVVLADNTANMSYTARLRFSDD